MQPYSLRLVMAVPIMFTGCGDNTSDPIDPAPIPDGEPACYASILERTCPMVAPVPTNITEIHANVRTSAMPLHCVADEEPLWDLSALHDLSIAARMFMLGEVHGTNEIGLFSGRLAKDLARAGRVQIFASELPIDFQEAFDRYLATGTDPDAEALLAASNSSDFDHTLSDAVRDLAKEGLAIKFALIDVPYGTKWSVETIAGLAEQLTEHRALVLDNLPEPKRFDASFPASYVTDTLAYAETLEENIETICSELSEDDCDTLLNMSRALWVAVARYQRELDVQHWFSVREEVIYFNLRQLAQSGQNIYLHMGAFHTNKYSASAGSRMAKEFEPTRDRVFSLAPGFGAGSMIYYGQQVHPLPASPRIIADALVEAGNAPHMISTTIPSPSCAATPLATGIDDLQSLPMAEAYDAYVFFQRLTPSNAPDLSTLPSAQPTPSQRIQRQREQLRALERQALGH